MIRVYEHRGVYHNHSGLYSKTHERPILDRIYTQEFYLERLSIDYILYIVGRVEAYLSN